MRNISRGRNCSCSMPKKEEMLEDKCSNVSSVDTFDMNCDCGFDEDNRFPMNPMYAQSYVPIQTMKNVFTPEVGLKMGTIFPELVSPYVPNQSIEEIEYIKATNNVGEGCNR